MKHQSQTEWLIRPLVTARGMAAVLGLARRLARPIKGRPAATATAPAVRLINPRRVRVSDRPGLFLSFIIWYLVPSQSLGKVNLAHPGYPHFPHQASPRPAVGHSASPVLDGECRPTRPGAGASDAEVLPRPRSCKHQHPIFFDLQCKKRAGSCVRDCGGTRIRRTQSGIADEKRVSLATDGAI